MKNHLIISTDAENGFNKVKKNIHGNTLKKVDTERLISIWQKPFMTNQKPVKRGKLKTFLLKTRTRQRCPLSPHIFNKLPKTLPRAIRKEKKTNGIHRKVIIICR